MPIVTLNKNAFENYVGKKLPLDKLKENISYLGTDLEKIEGNEIHVEVFPNRPDMLSEQGFARAFSSFIGVKKGLKKYDIKKGGYKVIVDKSVSMRPYTVCAIIKNIKFNDEKIRQIMQIQEKLATTHGRNRKKSEYGIYPSEKINFPINYIAKDPRKIKFKPLGFDKEMLAIKVEQIHPKGREYKKVAEGWKKYPFFIDNKGGVMSMLPYTNSEDTGKIDEKTKEIFIECTGTDLNNIKVALNIFVTMFADMGGEIYSVDVIYPNKKITTPDLAPKKMKVNIKYISKMLGIDLKESDVKKYLERMGYGYMKGTALVPSYRADILHQVDLVEDIAIAYGYQNFNEEIPKVATIANENEFEVFKRNVAEVLAGLNLTEVSTYHLIDKETQTKKCGFDTEVIEIIDPVSKDYNSLRLWVVPSLLNVLNNNKHNEFPQRIFEIGNIFKKNNKTESGVAEAARLAVLLCHGKTDFTEIKQILDYILRMLGVKYSVVETEFEPFLSGRVGRVIVNGKKVAYIGEISPEVLKNFELEMPVTALELNLTDLFEVI